MTKQTKNTPHKVTVAQTQNAGDAIEQALHLALTISLCYDSGYEVVPAHSARVCRSRRPPNVAHIQSQSNFTIPLTLLNVV
eukprot:1180275-Prorocentrum_minimum.AAC.5